MAHKIGNGADIPVFSNFNKIDIIITLLLVIGAFLKNASKGYSLEFFVLVCGLVLGMITQKGLYVGTRNFNIVTWCSYFVACVFSLDY